MTIDYFGETYLDSTRLVIPDPELDAAALSVGDLVTLHAKLLYELPYFPRGTLAERHRGRRTYYSVQTTVNHRRQERYLSLKRDSNLIEQLRIKKQIRTALTKIRRASEHLKGYRRRLAAKMSVIGHRYAENYVFYTNKIYVRSTTEAAIVEMLHKRHVRFEYEAPTEVAGWIIHPDFKYIVDGRSVYHEHLGMLDREDYASDWRNRQERYRRAGLKEGTELLISRAHGKYIDLVEIEQMLHTRGVF